MDNNLLDWIRNKLRKHDTQLSDIANQWLDWTPTLTWTTATPSGIATKARYKQIGKTIFFNVYITCTDGLGATGLSITLPIAPKTMFIYPSAYSIAGSISSQSSKTAYIRDNGTNNDVTFMYLATLTAGQNGVIRVQGFYEIA